MKIPKKSEKIPSSKSKRFSLKRLDKFNKQWIVAPTSRNNLLKPVGQTTAFGTDVSELIDGGESNGFCEVLGYCNSMTATEISFGELELLLVRMADFGGGIFYVTLLIPKKTEPQSRQKFHGIGIGSLEKGNILLEKLLLVDGLKDHFQDMSILAVGDTEEEVVGISLERLDQMKNEMASTIDACQKIAEKLKSSYSGRSELDVALEADRMREVVEGKERTMDLDEETGEIEFSQNDGKISAKRPRKKKKEVSKK